MSYRPPDAAAAAAQKRQVEQLAAAGDPLAIATLAAWERAAAVEPTSGMRSIAGLVPRATAFALGAVKRVLPALWAVETDRFDPKREFDLEVWRKAWLRSRWKENDPGDDVSYNYAAPIIEAIYGLASSGKGVAVETMDRIGKVANCCRDTVRKVIRSGETAGFLDSWHRTERRKEGRLKGFVLREANAYVPLMPEDDLADARAAARDSAEAILPGDGVDPAQAWLARVARQIKRGERYFRGLFGRRLGLNLTPARAAPA